MRCNVCGTELPEEGCDYIAYYNIKYVNGTSLAVPRCHACNLREYNGMQPDHIKLVGREDDEDA